MSGSKWQFLHTDDQWHCALVPTYHYTRDGHRDSYFPSNLLSGIKRLEHNKAVYLQTRMWATYLHGEDDVLDPRETVLDYGHHATFDTDRGIDDTAWLADPRTPGPDAGDAADGDGTPGSDADELTLWWWQGKAAAREPVEPPTGRHRPSPSRITRMRAGFAGLSVTRLSECSCAPSFTCAAPRPTPRSALSSAAPVASWDGWPALRFHTCGRGPGAAPAAGRAPVMPCRAGVFTYRA